MNQKYKILSFILMLSYGFFFTTRLWNVDDRPRFHNWDRVSGVSNQDGRIRLMDIVYVEPLEAIDIILELTHFPTSDQDLQFEIVIYLRDGHEVLINPNVMNETEQLNQTRIFKRMHLTPELIDWHFVGIYLVDPLHEQERNLRQRLTADWRLINRIEQIPTIKSYDIEFPDLFNNPHDDYHDEDKEDEVFHHDHYPHHHEQDTSVEGLSRQLYLSVNEYNQINEWLEDNPDDDILRQSLEFYTLEIKELKP